MAESTLSLGYADFMAEVAYFLGYGRSKGNWTEEQGTHIDAIVQRGVRQFYDPRFIPGQNFVHEWSFLKPIATLVTVAGTEDYDLPDDYGGLDGDLTYLPAEGWVAIKPVGEVQIRTLRMQQAFSATGRPVYAAVQPKPLVPGTGQRFRLMLWPNPSGVHTIQYRYTALQAKLSDANPFPMGGQRHAETVLESCLAAAERDANDEMGLHTQEFLGRLQASISADIQAHRAEYLGYNGDPGEDRRMRNRRTEVVTVNGVMP